MFSKDVRKGEIEKNPEMIQAPVVEKMERKIEAANEDIVKAKQEVERLLKEKRQQLETELIEGAKIRYEQTEREVGAETRETLNHWLEEIYEGKHGIGILVLFLSQQVPSR